MTGLDKIIEQILADATTESQTIIEATAQADKVKQQNKTKVEATIANGKVRAKSSSDLKKRQAILKAKQEIINGIVDKAYAQILEMEDAAYFEIINKMVAKYALPKTGEICFNAKDLKRLPAGYDKKIAEYATANGGSLTLSDKTVNLDGGFVLIYGGIEENCSIKAMFNSEKEKLADKVNALLFS